MCHNPELNIIEVVFHRFLLFRNYTLPYTGKQEKVFKKKPFLPNNANICPFMLFTKKRSGNIIIAEPRKMQFLSKGNE